MGKPFQSQEWSTSNHSVDTERQGWRKGAGDLFHFRYFNPEKLCHKAKHNNGPSWYHQYEKRKKYVIIPSCRLLAFRHEITPDPLRKDLVANARSIFGMAGPSRSIFCKKQQQPNVCVSA